METTKLTYDISRCYLQDRKGTLPEETYKLLHGWIRARNFKDLAACGDLSAHDVTGAEGARTLLQLEAFFSKNASFTDSQTARLSALVSFEMGEDLCEETNNRLDAFLCKRPCHHSDDEVDLARKIRRAQYYIESLLGPFQDFLHDLPKLVQVTAGATATRPRRKSMPFLKISKKIVCTPGAFPYIDKLSEYFGYGPCRGMLVSRNRVAFVPKSWKTERTIACEPEGNVALQLAFDKYAKRRLRRKGLDLSDQTRNQQLAKEGSISDNLSTIDLSMASDTLAYNTVACLLPEVWFRYLRSIRSQYYEMYQDNREAYHKFSSMGNGATFAIETVVFAAACYAVGSKRFTVYGDDIIIEQHCADELVALLAFLGFVPNTDKTFTKGPFRESCGKSWYQGIDITPRYIRSLDGRKATWCHLANCMMEISDPYGSLETLIHQMIGEKRLPYVPYNEDSMSGVWIHPFFAYSEKLIRTPTRGRYAWRPRYKAYKAKDHVLQVTDSRALFLWHLQAFGKKYRNRPIVSSRYTSSSHRYVRKWVHWKPVVGAPDHLFEWSDNLVRGIRR